VTVSRGPTPQDEGPEEQADARAIAREQAALRRVAMLVARAAGTGEIFAAVAEEVARSLEIPLISVVRLDPSGTATQVGVWGPENPFMAGLSWRLDGTGVAAMVAATGRPARVDDYDAVPGEIASTLAQAANIRSGAGVPIVVDGRLWGVMMAMSTESSPLVDDVEERLASFTELVSTAIANAQAREDLHRLVDEQSALRRVATLVATAAPAQEVFDAVCVETGRLIGASSVNLAHFTPDGANATVAGWSVRGVHVPTGTRLPLDGDSINALVRRTEAPGRFDTYDGVPGELAARLRRLGIRSEVGAPVVVAGQVWGALIAGTDSPEPLPPGTEQRVASFAELVGMAVANATDHDELVSSRARIVAAGDAARRRLVRDLHDGAQQRLVTVVLDLELANQERDKNPAAARRLLDDALANARDGIGELRELAAGVHPSILTNRGLQAACESLADRCPVPVALSAADTRYPPLVEAAAYFVVAEALTNIGKHSHASAAEVRFDMHDSFLVVEVTDDGAGGATFDGSGLVGLRDRVEALGGTLSLSSPPGRGTNLRAMLRIDA
jgi:GAF domain-containing protein